MVNCMVDSLMVMCTYSCQLDCAYCYVERMGSSMPEEILYKAIRLLLTTASPRCQLRFWGGEPLLRWEFVKNGIKYAQVMSARKNKKIKFMITTNGLLLNESKLRFLKNFPVEIMFSLDGSEKFNSALRALKSGRNYYKDLFANLEALRDSGVPYFVNMVVTPKTALGLSGNLRFLYENRIKRVQLGYQNGIFWTAHSRKVVIEEVERFMSTGVNSDFLMNFVNECEPTILSTEIITDIDGKIYYDAAVFMEKVFPGLRNHYYVKPLDECKSIDSLYCCRDELLAKFQQSCSTVTQKKILFNNIDFGLELENSFKKLSSDSLDSNEHPLLIPVVRGDFSKQNDILPGLGINSLFLYVEGPCLNNCIFCKQKKDFGYSDIFKLQAQLQRNVELKALRLCIIGNEPLAHPGILRIISLAVQYGFLKVEIMTSGEALFDRKFASELIKRGVSSFSLPVFSDKAAQHDMIVGRRGSFLKLMQGIKNAKGLGAEVFVHSNLIKQNINSVKTLERLVRRGLNLPFVILPIRPKSANMPYKDLMPSYKDILTKLSGINSLMGFPICVTARVQEKALKGKEEISDSMKLYILDQKFVKINICRGCCYKNSCLGLFKEYADIYGVKEISAIVKDE
ncbi:MAG: Anaerobic sulfatase-maturating enzyme [Candidatus Omnitrophica bacterium ADurb.Bin205]|nr:MAG: Anaerobic sulfatase-maturating enzyme [Candidatus Omnitrophica bacterium ADurb.Bin205]